MNADYRDNPINWSLNLGRLAGIRVRLHVLFILWVGFELLRSLAHGSVLAILAITVLLFGVVLLHELGHCFGARAVGGDADEILLWPLGGLAMVRTPMRPGPALITTAAGPAVNLILCLLTLFAMTILGSASSVLWNPLGEGFGFPADSPRGWGPEDWLTTFWVINYSMLLFNLLPTFPLDGGRLLQGFLWYRQGYRRATLIATFVGMIGAVIFGLVGLACEQILLVCIAFFGYLTCLRERMLIKSGMLDEEFGFGGSSEFDEPAPARQSWLARRRARRAAAREQRERQREAALEREIDDILRKVHDRGLHALTPEERRKLQEGTARRQH